MTGPPLAKARQPREVVIAVALILGIALPLRLINLEGWPRPLADEGIYGYIGSNYFQGQLGLPYRFPSFNSPLMLWLFGMMTTPFGPSFFVLRLPGAIMGSLTCVLVYLVGRRLYGHWVGLLAALFLALASLYPNRSALLDNGVTFFLLLAVWSCLKLKEEPRSRWGILAGVASGLSVLSKLPGVMTPFFVFLQWSVDRKLPTRPLVWGLAIFTALAAIYPLMGAIGGWNQFVSDLFPVSRRTAEEVASLTEALLWQRPTNQLDWAVRFGFSLWGTGGLLSLFYLLGRGGRGGPIFTYGAAVVVTYMVVGSNFWWAFLTPLYPAYCLALAVVVRDSLVRPRGPLLVIFLFLLLLPTFAGGEGPGLSLPQGWGRWGFFLLVMLALILPVIGRLREAVRAAARAGRPLLLRPTVGDHRYSARLLAAAWAGRPLLLRRSAFLLRGLTALIIGLSVLDASADDLRSLFSDATADMRQVATYLKANLQEGQMAAMAAPLAYLLGEQGIPYTDVAFYTTRIELADFSVAERYPRFNRDVSLERMKYFVHDYPFTGLRQWNAALRPILTSQWSLVATVGDYIIYKNPAFPKDAILSRDDNLADLAQVEVELSDLLVVRNDALEKVSGQNSLRIDLDLEAEHALYVYTLAEPEDWTSMDALSLWWYGDQVGLVTLELLTSDEWAAYRLAFDDNWLGWRRVYLPLAEATPLGNPSWKAIRGLALQFQSLPASGTVRLDDLRLRPKAS